MLMTDRPDADPARTPRMLGQPYWLAWALVGLVVLIDGVWLQRSGYRVSAESLGRLPRALALLSGIALGLAGIARAPRYRDATRKFRYTEVSCAIAWSIPMLCFAAATGVLSYLTVTVRAPLIDAQLAHLDRSLGFDWVAVYRWVMGHETVNGLFSLAYRSGTWQLVLMPIVLALLRRQEVLAEFVFHFMLSCLAMLFISTWMPANSAFIHFDVADQAARATVSDFARLRDGTPGQFDLAEIQGLVSFPSFHSALAVFFAYAMRGIPLLSWCALILNTTMLLSTPTHGGHYLIDTLGGIVLAIMTITGLRAARRGRTDARVAVARASPV